MTDTTGHDDQVPKFPRAAKGGVLATADIPLLKRALKVYLTHCNSIEGYSDRDSLPDLHHIGLLLHRLGRIEQRMAKQTKQPSVRYEVITQEDPDSDDLIIPLPIPLLKDLGWKEGDEVEIGIDDKGKLYLKKANK